MISEYKTLLDAKLVVPREAQAFLDPIREDYQALKKKFGHKNYFKNDLGIKGAFNRARMLGLHQSKGLKILDIATGSAMFPAVCNHYGHHATATDVPANQEKAGAFHECVDLLGIDVKPLTVTSPSSLPEEYESGDWDLITAFQPNFDGGWEGSGPWDSKDWAMFIQALFDRSLVSDGRLCFLPNGESAEPLANAADAFSGVSRIRRWGVWIFSRT